jgi:hypothetical protein
MAASSCFAPLSEPVAAAVFASAFERRPQSPAAQPGKQGKLQEGFFDA